MGSAPGEPAAVLAPETNLADTVSRMAKKQQSTRVVSDTQKAAMAAGREAARTVNAYLVALDELRPKRGRKVSREELEKRLESARVEAEQSVGTARLLAIQLVEDLENRIRDLAGAAVHSLEELEDGFVRSAKAYSESKNISYSTWRKAGVPAALLKRAGITRSAS